jgi:hypothetical protein
MSGTALELGDALEIKTHRDYLCSHEYNIPTRKIG